jgi:hypothetical protein
MVHINFLMVSDMARPGPNFIAQNILMAGNNEECDDYQLKVDRVMMAVKKALKSESGLSDASKDDFFTSVVREETGAKLQEVEQKPNDDHRRRFSTRAVLMKTLQQPSSDAATHCPAVVRLVVLFYCFYLFPL